MIRPVEGKGHGLVATKTIKAGEVVACELPAVHWVYASWASSACAWCVSYRIVSPAAGLNHSEALCAMALCVLCKTGPSESLRLQPSVLAAPPL